MLSEMILKDAEAQPQTFEYKFAHGLLTLADQEEALKDLMNTYWFAFKVPGADVEKCQDVVCKNPGWAYRFAKNIPMVDIEKCQEAACKDAYYAYAFARDIKGANIEYCQEAACKYPEEAYLFARDILGANIEKCRKVCKGTRYETFFDAL